MGCGATLVSSKHVITAAHCIDDKNGGPSTKAEELTMMFGVHNKTSAACIFNADQSGCSGVFKSFEWEAKLTHLPFKTIGVSRIIMHPEWSGSIKNHIQIQTLEL